MRSFNIMHYDTESNIISLEISKGKIDHVREVGNFLIHVAKNEKPILIEILDASKLVKQLNKFKQNDIKKIIPVN